MRPFTILIIDDEEAQLQIVKNVLTRLGYKVFTANRGQDGFALAKDNVIDLVITDNCMPEWDGFMVLQKIKELNPDIDVVVMTAYGSIESAVKIMKADAYDYLIKPIEPDVLRKLVKRVEEKRQLMAENQQLREQIKERFKFDGIFSQSSVMDEVLSLAGRVASSKTSVLIRGESGTGKELIAKAIHYASPRKDKACVVVNVASLPEGLLESELFGHERGSFTGATRQRIGRFEQAHGGTLFIDELGDIPLSIQVKLLRAIQFGHIERVGGNETIMIDVRIISATNRNIEEMIQKGEFREDLYYRLNVVTIWLPPLRRRKTDIPLLIEQFIKKFSQENKKPIKGITVEALDQLMKYDFRGNVRELENIIERAVVLCRNEYITQQDLPSQMQIISEKTELDPSHLQDGYRQKMKAFECEMIQESLKLSNGNQSAAARLLHITERHLRSRLQKLGLKK